MAQVKIPALIGRCAAILICPSEGLTVNQTDNRPLIAAALFGIPGLLITLAGPFKGFGDTIKPGLGDLMNGLIGLSLIILAPIAALIVCKRSDR